MIVHYLYPFKSERDEYFYFIIVIITRLSVGSLVIISLLNYFENKELKLYCAGDSQKMMHTRCMHTRDLFVITHHRVE